MNARHILPLLILSAFPFAGVAEPLATASTPASSVPPQSEPARITPAPESGVPDSNPIVSALPPSPSPQSAPAATVPVRPPNQEMPGKSPPGAQAPAKSRAAKHRAAERNPAELRQPGKEKVRIRHPRPEPESARHAHARHERIRQVKGAAPATRHAKIESGNPVIEAINLVAITQRAEIEAADRKVSESDWWADTLERDWIVKRPFGPGIFDSTHWFYVSYKVNGRILMSWFVDLGKGTVSDIAPPEKRGGH